jgi:hypothetical protein
MSSPIYCYDQRGTFDTPVFIVYDNTHVEKISLALYGEIPKWMYVTNVKMHTNPASDPYKIKNRKKH